MDVHKPDPASHELLILDHAENFRIGGAGSSWQLMEPGEREMTTAKIAARQLSDNERVHQDLSFFERRYQ